MKIIGLVVGVWLVAVPSTRAQRVSMPLESAGRVFMSAPVPQLQAPSVLAPAALLIPALSAPSAPLTSVAAPTPLKLTAVDAAVARFVSAEKVEAAF